MFERFTDGARRVVVLAQEEARMLGHHHIGSEHLLLGLAHDESGMTAHVLTAAGITLERVRVEVEDLASPGSKPPTGHIPFTRQAKRILELSLREALEQKKSYIGTEHILLGLIREPGGAGAQIIQRLGGPLSAVRQQVLEAAAAVPPDVAADRAEAGPWPWPPAPDFARAARIQSQANIEFRELLTSIDRRLASIERHIGVPSLERGSSLSWMDRRLARIERHLGIAGNRPEQTGQAGSLDQPAQFDQSAQADEETGEGEQPTAGA
jgi:ATP-dependent Clp protease ATP-binding subunit ClpA